MYRSTSLVTLAQTPFTFKTAGLLVMLRFVRSILRASTNKLKMNNITTKKHLEDKDLHIMTRSELVTRVRQLENECNILKSKSKIRGNSRLAKIHNKRLRSDRKKRRLAIDYNKTRMVALKIAYLGWDLEGFQSNPGLDDTIESLVLEALRKSTLIEHNKSLSDIKYTKCGRTDKEVSAFQQVMSFELRSKFPLTSSKSKHNANVKRDSLSEIDEPQKTDVVNIKSNDDGNKEIDCDELDYPQMLNTFLPPEIRVLAWSPISETFNARFDCSQREYHYIFPKGKLNITDMQEAAKTLEGLNDYRNFCKLNVRERINHVRMIYEFRIEKLHSSNYENDSLVEMYQAVIIGSGFLYHQVRYMMSVLLLVGLGKEEPSITAQLLDINTFPSRPQYGLTEAYPLTLYRVSIPSLNWQLSPFCRDNVRDHLSKMWCNLSIRTAMTQSLLNKFIEESSKEVCGTDVREVNGKTPKSSNDFLSTLLLAEKWKEDRYAKLKSRKRCLSIEESLEGLEKKMKRKLDLDKEDVISD